MFSGNDHKTFWKLYRKHTINSEIKLPANTWIRLTGLTDTEEIFVDGRIHANFSKRSEKQHILPKTEYCLSHICLLYYSMIFRLIE